MQFEHLIAINDPANPLLVPLSREQLWNGLLYRVEDAVPFLPGLESCTIVERTATYLRRELNFGSTTLHDKVTMADGEWVRFEVLASEQHAGGSLTIALEEPEPGYLFLRFSYQSTFATTPNPEESAYVEYVKSAYHQSDLDCVRLIRTLAAGGTLQ